MTTGDLSSALPDTPFLFSPCLPHHDVSSSPLIDRTNKLQQKAVTEECWHSMNEMLSAAGFGVLLKQQKNDRFCEMICDRLKEVLNQYGALKTQNEDVMNAFDALKTRTQDVNLQNEELKNQLHISSEKMNDLKQEMSAMQREKTARDDENDDMLMNVKRQLEHCKNIIEKKNEQITKIKHKLQTNIRQDTLRRESVEAIFSSINKRNARKNNKKDEQQMDVMAMYEEERKKMQNEIKFLRKELRTVNQKWIGDAKDEKKTTKKSAWNVSFTASSKEESDDDDDDGVVMDMKWKTRNEIKKQIQNMDDIERANDLNRLETQKLREKLDQIYGENSTLENELSEAKRERKRLNVELSKRPSFNEWTRLRKELAAMNRELSETKKVASLRKYMETRQLMKRDKQIHGMKLTDIGGLPTEIMKEMLQDLCLILRIADVTVLVESVAKVSKCVECVPILEGYISAIVRVLMASDHAPELVKISKIAPKNLFDRVVPILKVWICELDKVAALTTFRAKIAAILVKRTICKENGAQQLQLHQIVSQVRELVESEEYLLNSKECFSNAQKELIQNPNELCNRIIRHFQHIFSIQTIEGVFPAMNQVYLELNESTNVVKTIKSILGLPQNCAVNVCTKELQKVMDRKTITAAANKENENKCNPSVITKWNDILLDIQQLLQCKNEDEIVVQCKELIDRCKEYDAVFPRVHNLVNQLRATLHVDFAHQILPKVKQLVAK
eukprot:482510_1